ncbi:hypothetical protein GS415_00725 [Rhodococcus hoagii]|nr:hypothetical protein [Prescottella equi]
MTGAIELAGGVITSVTPPLARIDAPDELAAHWITATSPDREVWERVEAALREHRVDVTDMIAMEPAEVTPDAEPAV